MHILQIFRGFSLLRTSQDSSFWSVLLQNNKTAGVHGVQGTFSPVPVHSVSASISPPWCLCLRWFSILPVQLVGVSPLCYPSVRSRTGILQHTVGSEGPVALTLTHWSGTVQFLDTWHCSNSLFPFSLCCLPHASFTAHFSNVLND